MAVTTERYVPSSGSVKVASTEYREAVVSVKRVSDPARSLREVKTLGGTATAVGSSAQAGTEEWEIVLLDDFSKGMDAGSFYKACRDAWAADTPLGTVVVIPAGTTAGMAAYALTEPVDVLSYTMPEMDAETENEARVTVRLACSGHTVGAAA